MMTEKLKGVPMTINGKEYIVTPLSPEQWQKIVPYFWEDQTLVDLMATATILLQTALSPNYPDLTADDAAALLFVSPARCKELSLKGKNPLREAMRIIGELKNISGITVKTYITLNTYGTRH
jgi:hypothetical protein